MLISFLTSGTIAGLLAFVGALTSAVGKPALGAFIADPNTAATFNSILTGVVALYAGYAQGVHKKV